ncbi:MAG: hypothetical protein JST22_20575 [Bacteroidetes bacterium]|nr:hypothetical protein [Bacteroidota bacterium]
MMSTPRSYGLHGTPARIAATACVMLALCLRPASLAAHGGEDHAEPAGQAAPPPAADAGLLIAGAQNDQFELVAKYPLPEEDGTAHLRLYLADYATNRPLAGAAFAFSFKPGDAVLKEPPRMVAPGVYDATVLMHRDTIYGAVVTVRVGDRTDFLELRSLYGHAHAEAFLDRAHAAGEPAAPARAGSVIPWIAVAAGGVLLLLGGMLFGRRAARVRAAGVGAKDGGTGKENGSGGTSQTER